MDYTDKEIENLLESRFKEHMVTYGKETEKKTEQMTEPIEQLVKKYNKLFMGGAILFCTLLVVYLGMAKYFESHFYFGTEINGMDISGKTLEDVKALMDAELNAYTLSLKERGGTIEQVKGSEVGLKYNYEDFKKIIDHQSGFKWVTMCFIKEDLKKKVLPKYDMKLLKERISQFPGFKLENIIEPKNPSLKYINNSYVIVEGDIGNRVDEDIFYSNVVNSMRNLETKIDLELMGCYIKPEYDSKSPQIIKARNNLNKYIETKIIYTLGDSKLTLDGSKINTWLLLDENFNIEINEEMIKEFINELSDTYNTVGKIRNFVTSTGETVKISGGDYYNNSIDKDKEIQYLISTIPEGKTITKEPIYIQNKFSQGGNYIGDTYVEISLEKQHIWFYKNGSLLVEGDVVTGNVSENYETRTGIYSLKYKAQNVVLRGPGYAAPVDYWMPFDGGIGIHDASWRSMFGNDIYKTNGSHGCVNSPYNVAKEIFNNIEPGTPIIVS